VRRRTIEHVRLAVAVALALGSIACGAPAASSPGVAATATASPLGSPTAADTMQIEIEVTGLI